jgi:hypothetical protein
MTRHLAIGAKPMARCLGATASVTARNAARSGAAVQRRAGWAAAPAPPRPADAARGKVRRQVVAAAYRVLPQAHAADDGDEAAVADGRRNGLPGLRRIGA